MPSTTADDEAIAGAKRMLRAAVQRRRESRSPEQRSRDDQARLAVVETALAGRPPSTVAAYLSTGAEPGTLRLVGWLAAHGVQVLLPVLSRGRTPAWARYAGPDALQLGRHGILEPSSAPLPEHGLAEAELVVAPAVAANTDGARLGRGGGWYDRALAHADPAAPVWVLLNTDEVLPAIPMHAWDRRVDALVTPAALLPCARARPAAAAETTG